MKQYTFTITVDEGSDEFWEDVNDKMERVGGVGGEMVADLISDGLTNVGLYTDPESSDQNCKLQFKDFEDSGEPELFGKPKIVQILIAPNDSTYQGSLLGLDDAGNVWREDINNGWVIWNSALAARSAA